MICFALLVHQNEKVVSEQIKNIQYFNPSSEIILYNGGTNKNFGKDLHLPICPYSRPIRHGNLAPYMMDIMRWVEEKKMNYEYLVNIDHDVLFIKHGYELFLNKVMREYDVMGAYMQKLHSPNDNPNFHAMEIWDELEIWKDFFQTDYFVHYFNPLQIYRKRIVKKIVANVNLNKFEKSISETKVYAIEEIFFSTLAMRLGAKCRTYPWSGDVAPNFVRATDCITENQLKEAIKTDFYYWVHPIKGEHLLKMSLLIKKYCSPFLIPKL